MTQPDQDQADAVLQRTGTHEAAHAVVTWYYSGRIVAASLGTDATIDGAVWPRFFSGSLTGARQQAVMVCAGCIATGSPLDGDDRERLVDLARRIVGLAGTPEQLQEEIARAQVAASWLCKQYKGEIEVVAAALVGFHELLGGFERRRHDL